MGSRLHAMRYSCCFDFSRWVVSGERLMVHPTSVTNSIDRLEKAGYSSGVRTRTMGAAHWLRLQRMGSLLRRLRPQTLWVTTSGSRVATEPARIAAVDARRTLRLAAGDFSDRVKPLFAVEERIRLRIARRLGLRDFAKHSTSARTKRRPRRVRSARAAILERGSLVDDDWPDAVRAPPSRVRTITSAWRSAASRPEQRAEP